MTHPFTRRDWTFTAIIALIAAFALVYVFNPSPTYFDSYYHFNAATRLASGHGLTDTYVWLYFGLPPDLPRPIIETPSHLYWMPATSLLSAASMTVFGVSYAAAQIPLALCLAGGLLIAALAGGWINQTRWGAWTSMALLMFAGTLTDYWGETDTFAVYVLIGGAALALTIQARATGSWRRWLAAGLLCGAGHLTRPDGLLLMMVAGLAALTAGRRSITASVPALIIGYLLVMTPWFIRMMGAVGAPLPLGGLQTVLLTDYLDIFRYPYTELRLADVGLDAFIGARVDVLPEQLAIFLVSEGWLILWLFMLWGLFRSPRHVRFTVGLFALGIHAAMMLVFPHPSANGALIHGATALMPWWSACTVYGLDALARAPMRRRPRSVSRLRWITVGAALVWAAVVTAFSITPKPLTNDVAVVDAVRPYLSPTDRVLARDPAKLYTYLGVGGAVLPQTTIDHLPALAEEFDLDYMVLEGIRERSEDGPGCNGIRATAPPELQPILCDVPPFLELIEDFGHARLYRFVR